MQSSKFTYFEYLILKQYSLIFHLTDNICSLFVQRLIFLIYIIHIYMYTSQKNFCVSLIYGRDLSAITEMKGGGPVVLYVVPLVCGFRGRDNLQSWCQLYANLYELKSRIWFREEYNQQKFNRRKLDRFTPCRLLTLPQKKSLKLYFYRKLQLLSFLLMYSLLEFQ